MRITFKFFRMKSNNLILADRLFTGRNWLPNHIIEISNGLIRDCRPAHASDKPAAHYPIIAPAFMDIQVYGAGGRLFSVYPEPASLQVLYEHCLGGGTSHFQPTVATNTKEVFFRCIDAVRDYRDAGGKGCIGLHLEGPWINPVKRGAHMASLVCKPADTDIDEMLAYGEGVVTMITLAPEVCTPEQIRKIQARGIIVSAGHSNASYTQATDAFDKGITTATHLFNAMSSLQHREPGMVGAIFNHTAVHASIIPDGYHVDFAAIRIAKKQMGERLFAITDAVTETAEGPYPHQRAGDKYESGGILSGSAMRMSDALLNLIHKAGIETDEALRMVSMYPAAVMKLDQRKGSIAVGYDADLVALREDLTVIATLSSGN
jgi:N-acetylglucosamine-6-phosphate deacetylase